MPRRSPGCWSVWSTTTAGSRSSGRGPAAAGPMPPTARGRERCTTPAGPPAPGSRSSTWPTTTTSIPWPSTTCWPSRREVSTVTGTSAAVSGGTASMGVRRILAGALTAPLLVLSACGGGDSVADPPVSSAPTSGPTTQPPKRESAEHFIRRFYAAEQQMENSGLTAQYERMVGPCRPCSALVKQVKDIYGAGGFIHWGGLTIDSISGTQDRSYTISFTAKPTRFQETDTGDIKTLPGGKSTDLLTLKRSSDRWAVVARARTSS